MKKLALALVNSLFVLSFSAMASDRPRYEQFFACEQRMGIGPVMRVEVAYFGKVGKGHAHGEVQVSEVGAGPARLIEASNTKIDFDDQSWSFSSPFHRFKLYFTAAGFVSAVQEVHLLVTNRSTQQSFMLRCQ